MPSAPLSSALVSANADAAPARVRTAPWRFVIDAAGANRIDVRGLGLMVGNEFRDAEGNPDGAAAALPPGEAAGHFAWFAAFAGMDAPAGPGRGPSSALCPALPRPVEPC